MYSLMILFTFYKVAEVHLLKQCWVLVHRATVFHICLIEQSGYLYYITTNYLKPGWSVSHVVKTNSSKLSSEMIGLPGIILSIPGNVECRVYSTCGWEDRIARPCADTLGLIIIDMWDGRFPPPLTPSASCHILIRCLKILFPFWMWPYCTAWSQFRHCSSDRLIYGLCPWNMLQWVNTCVFICLT